MLLLHQRATIHAVATKHLNLEGQYWIRTSDLLICNQIRYRCANCPFVLLLVMMRHAKRTILLIRQVRGFFCC